MKKLNKPKAFKSILSIIAFIFVLVVPSGCDRDGKSTKHRNYRTPIAGIMESTESDGCNEENGISGPTVYVSTYGECFHLLPTCAGKHPSPTSIPKAQARGKQPCMKCAREYSHLLK